MKIYQPMMFVGLGGTGCAVGAELERRLRDELCGPDGRDLIARIPSAKYLPYQLPSPVQFVYADLNEGELTALSGRAGSEEFRAAIGKNQHLTHGLVPRFDTYPQVAMSLRANALDTVRGWLPGTENEPRIAPLLKGAGQLPTVGRAALFETFRGGLGQAQAPINEAIGAMSNSGDELLRLGGRLGQSCDVFVAFSVAGGTGAGIFYDYLYLIGDAFQRSDYRAQIYPLVLMPSAFDDKLGGGRRARLNAARSLVDLFRLVDSQNGAPASLELSHRAAPGSVGVLYPGQERATALLPSTVQTGFLFSGSAGVRRDDLHRSIVSLILSLIGTGQQADAGSAGGGERFYQSFADDFINRGVEREVPADIGIGLRGVSTSLVASMTIPVDDLADVVASRLLARALAELAAPPPGGAEENRAHIESFVTAANLEPVYAHQPPAFTDVDPVNGADEIVAELRARGQAMESNVRFLEERLRREVSAIAADFDPGRALEGMLGRVDLLRARRVLEGDRRLPSAGSRAGVVGLLEDMRRVPRPPAGIGESMPQLGDLRDRFLGLSRMRWADGRVQNLLEDQDRWYAWQAERAWNGAWSDQAGRWGRTLDGLRAQLSAVVDALEKHVQEEPGLFAQSTAELYRSRVGVTYLLPPHGDLDAFYRDVLERFVRRDHTRQRASEVDVVNTLLGADGWLRAWQAGRRSPGAVVAVLRERLKQEVKRLFTQEGQPGTEPLLPTMASLLTRAARPDEQAGAAGDDIRQFEAKIHGLVPAGFTPQGTGDLKVLISYPAGGADESIERFLRDRLRLPRDPNMAVEFRPIAAESIAVVLFRTSMGLTEVPEVREIIHFWSEAVAKEGRQDFLKWRQRLGYDYAWILTTEADRVRVLHHMLCAMWNGYVRLREGDDLSSPAVIRVQLGHGEDRVAMTLPLARFGRLSSWGSLLRSYEEWVLADDEPIRRDFCAQLMHTSPEGLTTSPVPPSAVFVELCKVAEIAAEEMSTARAASAPRKQTALGHLYDFWTRTFPAALDLPFENVTLPVADSLRELFESTGAVRRGRAAEQPAPHLGDQDGFDGLDAPW